MVWSGSMQVRWFCQFRSGLVRFIGSLRFIGSVRYDGSVRFVGSVRFGQVHHFSRCQTLHMKLVSTFRFLHFLNFRAKIKDSFERMTLDNLKNVADDFYF